MAQVSISQAAKMAGISRTTMYRYIADGKVSKQNGKIDTSELIRVFGDLSNKNDTNETETLHDTIGRPVTVGEREVLYQQIELLKAQNKALEDDKKYFQDLFKTEQESHKLLEHQLSTSWIERVIKAIKG